MRDETQHCDALPTMRTYNHLRIEGGTYFFTLTMAQGRGFLTEEAGDTRLVLY